ncbi:transcription activator MBF2 domain-containing protein [Phthorimaea operculella]|nr:transcription activator MBF2 domain-containing protein [Phthorimaea operculella]
MYKITSLLLVLYVSSSQANDIRLGHASPSSRKIFSELREASPALWTRNDDVVVTTVGTEVISAIYVTDLREDNAGEAYIESGGIGMKTVTIGLRSPSILRGYKFQVEVYADDSSARYFGHAKGGYPYPSGGLSGAYDVKGGSTPYYDNGQYARKW